MTAIPQPLQALKAETTPGEFAHQLRSQGDIFHRELEGIWVVTDYRLAETVLKSPSFSADRSSFFISRMPHIEPQAVGSFFGVVSTMMVASDAPQHTARRKLGATGLADHILDDFRPTVLKTVDTLLARVASRKTFDFAAKIAQELPSMVLADLFSIPTDERVDFYNRANSMTQFFGASSGCPRHLALEANSSAAGLSSYFTGLIAQRKKAPKQDFLSILLQNQESLSLDDSEVISQAINMLVAGKVTTTDQICNNLNAMLTTDVPLGRLRSDPRALEAAIEEFTRLDPSVNFVFRVAKEPIRLGQAEIKAGDVVFVSIHAVNRDPVIFEQPDACRLDRARNPHLSYGHGAHYCLGAKLGRIQMNTLFDRLLQLFPNIALSKEKTSLRKNQSLAFSGFESLHLEV